MQAEISSIDNQVLLNGEIRVEIIHLRYHADTNPGFACRKRHRHASQAERSPIGFD